jgi:hypothetical protein
MHSKLCLAIVLGLAAPAAAWAASGGGHGFASGRPFAVSQRPFVTEMRAQPLNERQHFAGLGASGAYTTLLSGTFPTAPYEGGVVVLPPNVPYYVVQYAPPPPPRCVRPLLIHLVPVHAATNLPHLVYGTSFDCPG